MALCKCGRGWKSLAHAHCMVCHAHFKTVRAFDLHRGPRGCIDPQESLDLKLVKTGEGYMWSGNYDGPTDDKTVGAEC